MESELRMTLMQLSEIRLELAAVTEQRDKALQKIKNQAERIAYLEGATNHATGTPLSKAIEQRDKLAAGLEVAQQVGIQLGEQRDRLAEALNKLTQYDLGDIPIGIVRECNEALQSLNQDHTVDANDMIADVKGGSDDFDQFRPFDF
jgi:lipopolysaccharide biosynthesis regulator YciM